MIIDYRTGACPLDFEADLCIIGAGAAGIAIARSFVGTSIRVCLVESGGFSGEERNQALYEGASIGTSQLDPSLSRMRVFGGTCNLWGGGCIPFADLARRDWVPHSGWPVSHAELEPYYTRARSFCQLGPHPFVEGSFVATPARPPIDFGTGALVNRIFAFSPILFGQAYRDDLCRAPNIRVLLHANLLHLESCEAGRVVGGARIASLEGRAGTIRARDYVLACGAIENARLLLMSNDHVPAGLGNDHDLVGRFFMDHPSGKLGTVHTPDPAGLARPYDRHRGKRPSSVHPEICLSPEAQRAHRILSARVRPFAMEGPVPRGIRASRDLKATFRARKRARSEEARLADRLCARSNGEPVPGTRPPTQGVCRSALALGLGAADILKAVARKLADKPVVPGDRVDLVGYFEQEPNPDSRVVLGTERDALGQAKVCVDWRLTALDRHTYRTAAMLFGNALGRRSAGEFRPEPWLADDAAAAVPQVCGTSHHLGTTRMADDLRKGVVDRHCKVHGIANLHVAGGSIFPTGGWAFPTFTIVAFSLRLAAHLRARLEQAAPFLA